MLYVLRKSQCAKKLNQIEKSKYEYPDQIDKVPIKSDFFDHLIMAPSFIGAQDHIKEYDQIEYDAREYVKAVKARNKEKEIGE